MNKRQRVDKGRSISVQSLGIRRSHFPRGPPGKSPPDPIYGADKAPVKRRACRAGGSPRGADAGRTPAQAGHSVIRSAALSTPGSHSAPRAGAVAGGSIGNSRCRRIFSLDTTASRSTRDIRPLSSRSPRLGRRPYRGASVARNRNPPPQSGQASTSIAG